MNYASRKALSRAAQQAAPVYGTCLRCQMPWNAVEGHIISITPLDGMFPLCEECWSDLETPAARLPYYRQLWEEWCAEGYGDAWEPIETAVKEGL